MSTDPTSTANDWLISDPVRLEAWRLIARDVVRVADLIAPDDESVLAELATWLLATHLRVRYSTDADVAGHADIDWHAVAQAVYAGLADATTED